MAKKEPEINFRDMTMSEIKDTISALNREIKQFKAVEDYLEQRFLFEQLVASGATLAAGLVFPPALIGGAAILAASALDGTLTQGAIQKQRREKETLRKKFKTVYRARPGRKAFNLAARKEREKKRKPPGWYTPFLPG